jgi:hypothetical protein
VEVEAADYAFGSNPPYGLSHGSPHSLGATKEMMNLTKAATG